MGWRESRDGDENVIAGGQLGRKCCWSVPSCRASLRDGDFPHGVRMMQHMHHCTVFTVLCVRKRLYLFMYASFYLRLKAEKNLFYISMQ